MFINQQHLKGDAQISSGRFTPQARGYSLLRFCVLCLMMNMLTYEGVFGEKGMDANCDLEWERKTIEGNVCIRPAPSRFAVFGPPGSLDGGKWQEEVEEQFVWPGRPALLPDGRLCVPTLEGLQIVAPAEETKCFPYPYPYPYPSP